MARNETITGTIIGLRDCGTLIIILVDAGDGRTLPIPMCHRAFRHLLDGEACEPDALIGRTVSFDGDLVAFLD